MPYSNNSNFEQVHTTTNGLTLFSGDVCLRLSLYDQSLSLSFCNAVTDSASGKRKFPKESAVNVLLTTERVAALYSIITHRTASALETGMQRSDSITCNRSGSTMLTVEVTPEKMIHLICYAEIGENRIPKKIIRFTFQDITPILGFNPQTGDFTADEKPIRAQFILFMKVLEGFLTASSYADAHSIKYTDRYSDRRLMSSIGAIASKLGVAAPSAPFYNNTVSGVNVQNGGNYQQPNGTSGVPVSEVSDLSAMFSDSPFA